MSATWDITGNAGTKPLQNFLGTSDAQPLIIQPSGNVGIGGRLPDDKLQVFTISNQYGITHTDGNIHLSTLVGDGGAFGTRSNHPLSFLVGGSPAMTIATSGNVGIGTTPTPADKLRIQSATNHYGITHTDGTITVGTFVGRAPVGGAQDGGGFGTKSNHPLSFYINGTGGGPCMTITTSEHVGIGTMAPADKLQVQTPTDNYGITHTDGTTTVGTYVEGGGFSGGVGTKSNHPLSFYVHGSRSMTIATNGNVGIGPLAPQAKLDISGGTTEGLHIVNANQSPFALMMNNTTFGSTDATGFGLWQGNTGTAVLTNNNNNAISISSSGNVGIGTTTPGAKLEVDGELSISGVASYDDGLLLTGSLADTGLAIANTSTGGKKFAIFSAGSGSSASAGSFNIYDDSASAYRLTIDSSGNVGIGTTSPSATLEVNGHTRVTVLEIVGGADLAEPFSVEEGSDVEPGTVMVIDENCSGNLKISDCAYDRKVAGIVSGANGIRAGLTLQNGFPSTEPPLLALVGRVYCKAEALSSPIQPGDLLTTSSFPGHAMKAEDGSSSSGAILGKAMTALSEETGLVLVLVNLQ